MKTYHKDHYSWAVIGAGPAGIAAVGKLIDHGIDPKSILWFDPEFSVGDFGALWYNVPSNTQVKLFLKFLQDVQAFNFKHPRDNFALEALNPEQTCLLNEMAQPLQWVTEQLCAQVVAKKTTVERLKAGKQGWAIQTNDGDYFTNNVILATGCEPKSLSLIGPKSIDVSIALNPDLLKNAINTDASIAVFGSSHSAILIIRNLLEAGINKIINFYRTPLKYALNMGDWILFDNTGLKGNTAEWARAHIDGNLPKNVCRYLASEENIDQHLPQCNKVIYAIGFERRLKPVIEGIIPLTYNDRCGIIAPGLFGLGIAFPQAQEDPLGNLEHRVGLWKFMDYLNQVLPIWLQYGKATMKQSAVV